MKPTERTERVADMLRMAGYGVRVSPGLSSNRLVVRIPVMESSLEVAVWIDSPEPYISFLADVLPDNHGPRLRSLVEECCRQLAEERS
jgi:hypothetical protein